VDASPKKQCNAVQIVHLRYKIKVSQSAAGFSISEMILVCGCVNDSL